VTGPVEKLRLFEPEGNLLFGILDRVATVADVAANFNAKVSTNGAGVGFERVGRTQHLAARRDGLLSGPDHADNRSTHHISLHLGKETLGDQITVVLFQHLARRLLGLHTDQLVALRLEATDNFTDDSTLHTIGLDLRYDTGRIIKSKREEICVCEDTFQGIINEKMVV
jgi:hypothetical protein